MRSTALGHVAFFVRCVLTRRKAKMPQSIRTTYSWGEKAKHHNALWQHTAERSHDTFIFIGQVLWMSPQVTFLGWDPVVYWPFYVTHCDKIVSCLQRDVLEERRDQKCIQRDTMEEDPPLRAQRSHNRNFLPPSHRRIAGWTRDTSILFYSSRSRKFTNIKVFSFLLLSYESWDRITKRHYNVFPVLIISPGWKKIGLIMGSDCRALVPKL